MPINGSNKIPIKNDTEGQQLIFHLSFKTDLSRIFSLFIT